MENRERTRRVNSGAATAVARADEQTRNLKRAHRTRAARCLRRRCAFACQSLLSGFLSPSLRQEKALLAAPLVKRCFDREDFLRAFCRSCRRRSCRRRRRRAAAAVATVVCCLS